MKEGNNFIKQFGSLEKHIYAPRKLSEEAKDSQEEGKWHPDHNLIASKFLIGKAATKEKYGSPNVYQSALNLYAALYSPEEIDQLVDTSEKYPDRMPILKQRLSVKPEKVPSREEFIEKVRHAMVSEVEFGECLSAEARKQLKIVMDKSEHTVIWTDGDSEGVPVYGLPGSKEQLKKIASAKFYNITRREIALEKDLSRADVLSVVAIEGKMKSIPKIVEKFLEKKIKRIIIIEDRAKNLIEAMELIKQTSSEIEVFPVWIRSGQWKDKVEIGMDLEDSKKELHAIGDISQLDTILQENNVFEEGIKIGSIFDLDGSLHSDEIRKKLQSEAVIKALIEKGWI
jgi:hypothetical protein